VLSLDSLVVYQRGNEGNLEILNGVMGFRVVEDVVKNLKHLNDEFLREVALVMRKQSALVRQQDLQELAMFKISKFKESK